MTDEIVEVDVEARRAIEAVLLAATEPVDPAVLAQLVEVPTARVEELCEQLASEYAHDQRGFTIAKVAGGYRFQTHPDAAPYVERFVLDGQHARLSGPSLETLAIIAYKQPISRAQLSAIRGVNVDATLRTLVARGYVEEVGHDPSPGNPALFGTTSIFLERLGLDSLHDLPPLADFVPEAHIVETLERGLRLPGETNDDAEALDDETDETEAEAEAETPEAVADAPTVDEVVDEAIVDLAAEEAAEVARADLHVDEFAVEKVDVTELQAGLDDGH
jgi:segregation and condensation protein B